MAQIVECVPNFSDGRNQQVIDAIADAMRNTPGCTVLDVDPGKSTNRTVYTFVGSPDAVVEGAFNAAKVAKDLIDMRKHEGAHPRFGAMDVCPFIPIANVTMQECVECSKRFAKRAGEELGLPMYLYEHASTNEKRKLLPQVREGEYEGLAKRTGNPFWKPDFGPEDPFAVPTWGCTATGARKILIAYNINILGTKEQAHRIALDIREQGRGPTEPGTLKNVKGIGWYVDEYNLAQVSVNLTDIDVTSFHTAFEECVRISKDIGVAVAGSEVVGLVPLEAMMSAADYYCKKEGLFIVDEGQKVRLVVERLGLGSVAPFKPQERIIEYIIKRKPEEVEPLASKTVREFIEVLGARTAAPGGGSASALMAAMGSGLGAMVGWMTYGSRKFESLDTTMRGLIPPLHHSMKDQIGNIDADTDAFTDYMVAMKMPKGDGPGSAEAKARDAAMQAGLKTAIEVPMTVMRVGDKAWDAMLEMSKVGNMNSKSDLQVGARALEVGIWGAYQNVLINMKDIKDDEYKGRITKEASGMADRAKTMMEAVLKGLDDRDFAPPTRAGA